MFHFFNNRLGHYGVLVLVSLGLFLPNLGGPALWDIDEGNNANAAREMLMTGDFVVPRFNAELRADKPALLYWLQAAAYKLYGINEFAARLPSALASVAAVLTIYEFGRLLFGAGSGLLAGVVLASTIGFTAAAHFANPDALLNALNMLSLLFVWKSIESADGPSGRISRIWIILAGAAQGFAMLAKGPVGLVMPLTIAGAYLCWAGRVRLLFDVRLLLGGLAFLLVAVPWFALVGEETRGEFIVRFFLRHNIERFATPLENHSGGPLYYVVVLCVGFAPWSIFLGFALWQAFTSNRGSNSPQTEGNTTPASAWYSFLTRFANLGRSRSREQQAACFLVCWIAVYFLFFTIASTKLPNYILPLYPAVALLTAYFLDSWQQKLIEPPAWALQISLLLLGLIGLSTLVGLWVAGAEESVWPLRMQTYPGLRSWMWVGAIPLAGAGLALWAIRRERRSVTLLVVSLSAVTFIGALAAGPASIFNDYKAPRRLARMMQTDPPEKDVRVGCYHYFQPSLVFYCQRKVDLLASAEKAVDFLHCPLPVYLCMPASEWEAIKVHVQAPCQLLGQQYDLYKRRDIVVLTNRLGSGPNAEYERTTHQEVNVSHSPCLPLTSVRTAGQAPGD